MRAIGRCELTPNGILLSIRNICIAHAAGDAGVIDFIAVKPHSGIKGLKMLRHAQRWQLKSSSNKRLVQSYAAIMNSIIPTCPSAVSCTAVGEIRISR